MMYTIKHAGFAEYEAGLADVPEYVETFGSYEEAKEREAVLDVNYTFSRCDRVSKAEYEASNEEERVGMYYVLLTEGE